MIVRKQLQLLIHVLQVTFLFATNKDSLINLKENETTDNSMKILSIDNIQYLTSSESKDAYLEIPRNVEKSFNETTKFNQTKVKLELMNDYPKNDDAIFDVSVDDFAQKFEYLFRTSNEVENKKDSTETLEDELFSCNATDDKTIQNLTVNSVGTEWIFLSWQPPCEKRINKYFTYLIHVCSDEKCFQANENNTRYNATNLTPCTEYTFTVKIIDNYSESDGVNITAKTNYNITEIGEVQDLLAHTTTNTINLSWKAPSKYPMCVHSYLITKCFDDICNNITVVNKEYVAKNLDPCKKYLFIIRAVSYVIQSDGLNITLKTNSPKPSKPQDPIVEASAYSLFIRWQPPEQGSMCVTQYRVAINSELTMTTFNQTNITINGLHACTSYTVYINAIDQDSNDGEMVTIHTGTVPTVSKPPILNVKESFVTINDIMLSWKIEKGNSSCILQSLKTICNYTSTTGHGYEIVNGNVEVCINSCIQDEFLIVNSMIKNVSPFTTYICWAYAINEAGVSQLSELTSITTMEDIPSAPIINVTNTTQFLLTWEAPTYLAGNLQQFELTLEWTICFPIPDWCPRKSLQDIIYLNGSIFTFEYSKAIPYTNYTVKIRARTNAGWGNYSDSITFQTPPKVSEMVSNFSYLIKNNEDNTNKLDTILKWGFPCSSNGIIEYFNIYVHGTRINYTPDSRTIKKNILNAINKNDIISINLNELKAEYNYTFEVSAKVKGVQDFGVPAKHDILYPAGIPPQPNEDYVKSITIDPSKARRSTTSVTLLLPLFPSTNGDIIYYAIIVSKNDNIASNTRFNFTNNTWPNISSWGEAMSQDFAIPYQATRLWWDPHPLYVADYGEMKAVKYTLGEDTNCKEISSNTKRLYCNGPLKPDTWYHVRMRAFTHNGYADSTNFLIKTNAEINVGLVTGVVFGILFFGILTTVMLLVRKCSPQILIRRFLHSELSGSPVPTPFSKKKFLTHCQQLIDNPGKLSNEFQLLQTLSVDLQMPTNTACLQANKKKNRYSDILPYDFSRVKLEIIDNDPNTDYINASFIKGYSGEDEYIACQGPKEETTFDFWRMIEQYNVNIIVMLTELIEKGKEKCYQYFPIIKETFKYENMTIRCTSELDYRFYTQRTLVLEKESKKRNIIHLHFKEWPDHDVPESFDSIIHFCQLIRRNILVNKGYIVVHCSAGIGRTGTLIAIDILLQHLRDNRKLDVFGTVYRLRHHRTNMVQKESQYAYVYNCIKQVLKNPYCLKTCKPPPMNPLYANTSTKK